MAEKENVPVESRKLEEIEKSKIQELMEEGESRSQAHHTPSLSKIQKIPFLLGDNKNFEKCYKPRVISFGPIHHDDQKFKPTKKYKLRLAHKFIQESGQELKILHRMVKEKIDELRACFEEEVTKKYNNEDLAWMLFVDGCAILQFIHSFFITYNATANDKNPFKKLGIQNHSVVFGRQDLFLLENQLPYCLLEWLRSSSKKKDELQNSIDGFIDMYFEPPRLVKQKKKWWNWKGSTELPKNLPDEHVAVDIEGSESSDRPTHLLDLLRKKLLELSQTTDHSKGAKGLTHSFRNVQELKSAGIHMKPSGSCSLRDVSFGKRFNFYPGHLHLPPMIVDDSTAPKFLNLIAYEMCPDFENDYGVTSYISFLNSLIRQPNDVRLLRKAGVLQNFLGSDEEVAKLFNEIGTDLVPDPDTYSDVKYNIQLHSNSKWMVSTAQWFHEYVSFREYFNSRTLWAVIGSLLVLGLTAAQVYLAA